MFVILFLYGCANLLFFWYLAKLLRSNLHKKLVLVSYTFLVFLFTFYSLYAFVVRLGGFYLPKSGVLYFILLYTYELAILWCIPFVVICTPYLLYCFTVEVIHYFKRKSIRDKQIEFKKSSINEVYYTAKYKITRKEFLVSTLDSTVKMSPLLFNFGVLSGFFLGSREIATFHRTIKLKHLHADLQGLKIIQISDIHISYMINSVYLRYVVEILKDIQADMLVVTGDIIDNNNAYLPVMGRFFHKLSHHYPLGIYTVLGNHDLIDNDKEVVRTFNHLKIPCLQNDIHYIKRGKGVLQLAGLSYPPLSRTTSRSIMAKQYFDSVFSHLNPHLPTILLNHNPADFEFIKHTSIDLVLSGHTHGGQIQFSPNRYSALNIMGHVLTYYQDLYYENSSYLYVNRGIGHWFPVRINCPAEITVFTLI